MFDCHEHWHTLFTYLPHRDEVINNHIFPDPLVVQPEKIYPISRVGLELEYSL